MSGQVSEGNVSVDCGGSHGTGFFVTRGRQLACGFGHVRRSIGSIHEIVDATATNAGSGGLLFRRELDYRGGCAQVTAA
jgi:hypothetical protein